MQIPSSVRHSLLWFVAGVVVLASTGSCAQPNEPTRQDAAVVAERLDKLSERIGGTPQQRTAGEVLQYHAYQDAIANCMARAGFTYTPPPFVDPYRGRSSIPMGIGGGRWLAPMGGERLGVTDTAELAGPQDEARPSEDYRKLSDAAKAKFEDALTGCIPRDVPDVNFPPAYYPLSDSYHEMLAKVAEHDDVEAAGEAYPSCMSDGGFPVTSYNELVEMVQARMGDAQPAEPGAGADARWSAVVAFERKAAQVDATCRQPVYNVAIQVVAPLVTDFERAHAADLATVAGQWADMVRRAAVYPEFPN